MVKLADVETVPSEAADACKYVGELSWIAPLVDVS